MQTSTIAIAISIALGGAAGAGATAIAIAVTAPGSTCSDTHATQDFSRYRPLPTTGGHAF